MTIREIFQGGSILDINIPLGWVCKIFLENWSIEDFNRVFREMDFHSYMVFSVPELKEIGKINKLSQYDFNAEAIICRFSEDFFCFCHAIDDLYIFLWRAAAGEHSTALVDREYDRSIVEMFVNERRTSDGQDEICRKFEYFLAHDHSA